MSGSSSPVTPADRKKMRGNWSLRSQRRAVKPIIKGNCRLLEIPVELRIHIYGFVFAPGTVVELRKERNSLKRGSFCTIPPSDRPKAYRKRILKCDRALGNYTRNSGTQTKWKSSISGIILVNKKIYWESVEFLYETSIFVFEPVNLTSRFCNTVTYANLKNIRKVCLQYEYRAHPQSERGLLEKKKAGERFAKFCGQLASFLPEITALHVQLRLDREFEDIVPESSAPEEAYSVGYLDRLQWVQPLKLLANLNKLMKAHVELVEPKPEMLGRVFRRSDYLGLAGPNWRTFETVERSWTYWVSMLFRGMARSIKFEILGCEEAKAWKLHQKLLDGYSRWRINPTVSFAASLPTLTDLEWSSLCGDEEFRVPIDSIRHNPVKSILLFGIGSHHDDVRTQNPDVRI